jgi:hypothetical protein
MHFHGVCAEMGKRKPTSVYIDEELLKQVKRIAIDRETNQTEAIDQGLRMWLGGSGVNVTIPAVGPLLEMNMEEAELLKRVLAVIRSGNRDAAKGLHAALEIGELLVEAVGRGRKK